MEVGPFAGKGTCRDCDTSDPVLAYRSGRMQRCIDCQHYWNLTHRSTGRDIEMAYTREEFVQLKRTTPRLCHYCKVDGDGLWAWNVFGVHHKRFETIGWDRLDSDRGYVDGNWVPCCPVCNAVKSRTFTYDEMLVIGPVIRAVLDGRAPGFDAIEATRLVPPDALAGVPGLCASTGTTP